MPPPSQIIGPLLTSAAIAATGLAVWVHREIGGQPVNAAQAAMQMMDEPLWGMSQSGRDDGALELEINRPSAGRQRQSELGPGVDVLSGLLGPIQAGQEMMTGEPADLTPFPGAGATRIRGLRTRKSGTWDESVYWEITGAEWEAIVHHYEAAARAGGFVLMTGSEPGGNNAGTGNRAVNRLFSRPGKGGSAKMELLTIRLSLQDRRVGVLIWLNRPVE